MNHTNGGFRKYLLTSSVVFLVGVTASAQQSPQSEVKVNSEGLQEIIVTATKRSSSLEKTPISITAISGDDLQNAGIASFSALAQETPGISMKSSGPGQTEFEMRGLTSSGGSSPTVGFYLDDTPLTAPAAAQNGKVVIDPSLYDLNRVEVLRGPQGTLYGSGSMGGTIKLISNQPDPTAMHESAQTVLSGTSGGGFNHAENGMINLPIINDTLALRVVGSESYTNGWIDRVVLNNFPLEGNGGTTRGAVLSSPASVVHHDVNDEELIGTRASILYKPTDRLTITATAFYQRIMQGGPSTFDSNPGTLAHFEAFDIREPFHDSFSMWNLTGQYHFDWMDVTSTTANWNRGQQNTQDQSENLQFIFGLPGYTTAAGGVGASGIVETDKSRQFSEELRFASASESAFQWLIGGFYSKFVSDFNLFSTVPGAAPASLFGTSDLIEQSQPTGITQEAIFGEASYAITSRFKATVGARWYNYKSTLATSSSGIVTASGDATFVDTTGRQADHGINPKLNLSYQVTDELMVFGTAAKGFRPGGANQPIPITGPYGPNCLAALQALNLTSAPTSYGPDSVWSYEAGEKLKLGNNVTVNASAYHERWAGVQQLIPSSCGFPFTSNTGTAEVNGGEIEIRAVVQPGLVWSGNAGYTDAFLTENIPDANEAKGSKLQDVSPWTASTAISYEFDLKGDWGANIRASYDFVDARTDATFGLNNLPAYGLANLRMGIFNDRWNGTIFVNNLTNKRVRLSDSTSLSANLPTFNRITTNQPLTIGVDVGVRF